MDNSECLPITLSAKQGIYVYSNVHVGISCPYYYIKVEPSKILNKTNARKLVVDFNKKWYYIYVHGRTLNT